MPVNPPELQFAIKDGLDARVISVGHPTEALSLAHSVLTALLGGSGRWRITEIEFQEPVGGVELGRPWRWQCQVDAEVFA